VLGVAGLAGQLGQLARTFNEMQRRLAELDSARKQFIANASHELRTPIFSLGGFVELLEEEDPSPEEPPYPARCEQICVAALRSPAMN